MTVYVMHSKRQTNAVSRTPNGCSARLQLQVAPDEREAVEAIARAESRSVGSAARLILLDGLAARRERQPAHS